MPNGILWCWPGACGRNRDPAQWFLTLKVLTLAVPRVWLTRRLVRNSIWRIFLRISRGIILRIRFELPRFKFRASGFPCHLRDHLLESHEDFDFFFNGERGQFTPALLLVTKARLG